MAGGIGGCRAGIGKGQCCRQQQGEGKDSDRFHPRSLLLNLMCATGNCATLDAGSSFLQAAIGEGFPPQAPFGQIGLLAMDAYHRAIQPVHPGVFLRAGRAERGEGWHAVGCIPEQLVHGKIEILSFHLAIEPLETSATFEVKPPGTLVKSQHSLNRGKSPIHAIGIEMEGKQESQRSIGTERDAIADAGLGEEVGQLDGP